MSLLPGPVLNGASGRLMAPLSYGGRSRKNFISRMPVALLKDPHVLCCMRIDMWGGRIGACCNDGITDNDTVVIIIARE